MEKYEFQRRKSKIKDTVKQHGGLRKVDNEKELKVTFKISADLKTIVTI